MELDLWKLYRKMLFSRMFEEAVASLWQEGRISGEMHMSTGEEAIMAGIVDHLEEGDAMALDHRGTAAMLMRGVNPVLLLKEFFGHEDGLCRGRGGHMHLFSELHLATSSGIVGAAGPAASGFALSAKYLRPGKIALAFFGEGAMNQGMLMESFNLAVVWKLPVLFVCKDNGWAISTQSNQVTAGDLNARARAFGLNVRGVNGLDVISFWETAGEMIQALRQGGPPQFLHARCIHLDGHFLGDALLRMVKNPVRELMPAAGALTKSVMLPGGTDFKTRVSGVKNILSVLSKTFKESIQNKKDDPLVIARQHLEMNAGHLAIIEKEVSQEVAAVVQSVLEEEIA